MGCCRKTKKKIQSKSDVTKKNLIEKKKNLINDKIISIEKINNSIPQKIIDRKNESNIQQVTIPLEQQKKSPSISSSDYDIDKTSPIKTFSDLQTFVQQNEKSVSIVLFYGRYCPYSKRTIPGLRQWVQANKDRIFLYEVDVEQASKLVEYYHIRTIPTIMAFEENNLIVPIWQRTATNVLSSSIDKSEFDNSNNIYLILDPPLQESNPTEIKQEQYLIILADQNPIDQSNSIHNSHSKSITSSEQSPYIWNRSIQSLDNNRSKESMSEYNGRMISQSTISNDNQLKNNYLDNHRQINEYQQYIHLPNCHEIFYEKNYENSNECNHSLSSDRFSTLTYQHVKDTNNFSIHQQEEICILYLGPNRRRGFEDNLSDKKTNPSKLSLLTLKSHFLSE